MSTEMEMFDLNSRDNDVESLNDESEPVGSLNVKMIEGLFEKGDSHAKEYLRNQKEIGFCQIHRLFSVAEDENKVAFLEKWQNSLTEFQLDEYEHTWLHCAVLNSRKETIIKFIIQKMNVNIEDVDKDGNTALHVMCMRGDIHEKETKQIMDLLIDRDGRLLLKKNINNKTPLEYACKIKAIFDAIKCLERLNLAELLMEIDKIDESFRDFEIRSVPSSPKSDFWMSVLTQEDQVQLLGLMRDFEGFNHMYTMTDKEFISAYDICNLDNESINRIVYNRWRSEEIKVIVNLIGIPSYADHYFYKSAVFLAMITGRWNLCMALVTFCQFDVVPFCLNVYVICLRMSQWGEISENVRQQLNEIKDSAEAYLTEIIDRVFKTDTASSTNIICDFLTDPNSSFGPIFDQPYIGTCKKFLSLPVCQNILDSLWQKKCCKFFSPFRKFIFHSLFYLIFISTLFAIILTDRQYSMKPTEIICYSYGLGYCFEEITQIAYYHKIGNVFHYFLQGTNICDILGLCCLLFGFIFRVFLSTKAPYFYYELFICFASILFSIRLLYFLSISKIFGPKLKIIGRMIVVDLLPVSVIFFILILSFGVIFQSLIFSNSSVEASSINSTWSFADMLWKATFTLFDAKYIIDESKEFQSVTMQDPTKKLFIQFLLLMFIIISFVMLMNMLIALFSQTVSAVTLIEEVSWKAGRWKFINDYVRKSHLPPPLNLFELTVVFSKFIKRKLFGRSNPTAVSHKPDLTAYHVLQAIVLQQQRWKILKHTETVTVTDHDRLLKIEELINSLISKRT